MFAGEFLKFGDVVYTVAVTIPPGLELALLIPVTQGLNTNGEDLGGGADCN